MFKLYWIAFSANTKSICYSMNISLISVTLHFKICSSTASLSYRNHTKITFLMCEQNPYLVWISCQCKRYLVLCSGGSRGPAPPPHPYFWTKLRLEGPKKIFFKTALPPPYLRLWMTALPPYLKVWICLCSVHAALRRSKYCSYKYL